MRRSRLFVTVQFFIGSSKLHSNEDLELILSSTFLADLEYHKTIGSTNDRALQLMQTQELKLPFLVLAETSTASRGRENRKWFSPLGTINQTLIIDADEYGLSMDRTPVVSLLMALSVAETIASLVPEQATRVKWPNDVYVDDRKISGILIERPPKNQNRLAIGIGINVNNSFATASQEFQDKATSLVDSSGEEHSLSRVIVELIKRVDSNLQDFKQGRLDLCSTWQQFCFLTGKSIVLIDGARTISGLCLGINSTGAIVIRTEGRETLEIISGSIESFR